jgi:hypothetical protein
MRLSFTRFQFAGFLLLLVGLSACDQAPVPPPFRPYEEPQPFEPQPTEYLLEELDQGSGD